MDAKETGGPAELVDDLAALVGRLVRELRKHAPESDPAAKALDYLKRKGLVSPLRETAQHVECPCCPIEVRDLCAVAHNLVARSPNICEGDLKRAVERMKPLIDAHFADRAHSHPDRAAQPVKNAKWANNLCGFCGATGHASERCKAGAS